MTSVEREKIIRDAIDEIDDWTPRNVAYAVQAIVEKWENDVDDAFQRGQDAFRESTIRY